MEARLEIMQNKYDKMSDDNPEKEPMRERLVKLDSEADEIHRVIYINLYI